MPQVERSYSGRQAAETKRLESFLNSAGLHVGAAGQGNPLKGTQPGICVHSPTSNLLRSKKKMDGAGLIRGDSSVSDFHTSQRPELRCLVPE